MWSNMFASGWLMVGMASGCICTWNMRIAFFCCCFYFAGCMCALLSVADKCFSDVPLCYVCTAWDIFRSLGFAIKRLYSTLTRNPARKASLMKSTRGPGLGRLSFGLGGTWGWEGRGGPPPRPQVHCAHICCIRFHTALIKTTYWIPYLIPLLGPI